MLKYVLGRLVRAVPALLGIITLIFILIHATPGDPVLALVGDFPAPEEYVRAMRAEFGLDRPLIEQYFTYLTAVARGDLGYSFFHRRSVLQVIGERMGATALLTGTALLVATLAGVGLGALAARRPFSPIDWGISGNALVGFSIPVFWLGQLLILVIAVRLGWLPAQGMVSLRLELAGWDRVRDVASHLVLPASALALRLIAMTTRLTRAALLEVLGRDFIRTALAKGASGRRVLFRHALPNALLPVVTFVGYNLGSILAGSALIETVFGWPGLGRLLYDSVFTRDYPVLLGIFLTVSVSVVVANLLTDLAYGYLDPRIRIKS
jgi:peptide/nickel transport system permease protein